jgi:hypothetical protein
MAPASPPLNPSLISGRKPFLSQLSHRPALDHHFRPKPFLSQLSLSQTGTGPPFPAKTISLPAISQTGTGPTNRVSRRPSSLCLTQQTGPPTTHPPSSVGPIHCFCYCLGISLLFFFTIRYLCLETW